MHMKFNPFYPKQKRARVLRECVWEERNDQGMTIRGGEGKSQKYEKPEMKRGERQSGYGKKCVEDARIPDLKSSCLCSIACRTRHAKRRTQSLVYRLARACLPFPAVHACLVPAYARSCNFVKGCR